jgi:surface carbohydrate biosynthesis protein (TIGR04326 family)
VEENAIILREKFLAWLYELGEAKIDGVRLIDRLAITSELSYWWMTLLIEKCNYSKSKYIDDAIKFIAFVDWSLSQPIKRVTLNTPNESLAVCIEKWCESKKIAFNRIRPTKSSPKFFGWKWFYDRLPYPFQAIGWLTRYLINRWPLRGVGLAEWRQTTGEITLFSYLSSLMGIHERGWENRYWTKLPEVIRRTGRKTNWLHLYVDDGSFKSPRHAAKMLRSLNATKQCMQVHTVLDSFISIKVIVDTVSQWFNLVCQDRYLRKKLQKLDKSSLSLWPLFEKDWRLSVSGSVAMNNLLTLNLMNSALRNLPPQLRGVYLQENQTWEFALIHHWRRQHHGLLVGFPHSTVRFWDLRYFFDRRIYQKSGARDFPLPDFVACSGRGVFDQYEQGAYPVDKTLAVEALRYLYLAEPKSDARRAEQEQGTTLGHPTRVLVMGEYLLKNTQHQLALLIEAIPYLSSMRFVVKAHPFCPINPSDYPNLGLIFSTAPLPQLLAECDVAYTSAVTSAGVDAYCAGIPVVSVLDTDALNLSPLRGLGDVQFVSSTKALASALISAAARPRGTTKPSLFFTLDTQMPRWRKLLLLEAS